MRTSLGSLSWRARFDARLVHAHLILGSAVYLRLTTMTLQALQCQPVVLQPDAAPTSVLTVDLSTVCYRGAHLVTAILAAWPVMFLFCIGFPLLTAAILYRSFHHAAKRALLRVLSDSSIEMADRSKQQLAPVGLGAAAEGSSSTDSSMLALVSPSLKADSSPVVGWSPSSHSRLCSERAGQQQAPLKARHVKSSSASVSVCASPKAGFERPTSPLPSPRARHSFGRHSSNSRRLTPPATHSLHKHSARLAALAAHPAVIRESEVELTATTVKHRPEQPTAAAASSTTAIAAAAGEKLLALMTAAAHSPAHVAEASSSVAEASQPAALGGLSPAARRQKLEHRQALRELSKDIKRQEQFGSARGAPTLPTLHTLSPPTHGRTQL